MNDRVKYLLVVAGDRALTKFITETLLGRKLDKSGPHLRGNGWQIARAHSALEGLMVLTKSEQRIDAILVDQSLPDRDALSFLDRVRKEEAGSQIPLFVMTERGRDQLTRKLASDSYAVTGFIDKPVTAESLRRGLRNLERMRHVLIVEKNADIRAELEVECRRAGFSVDMMQTARAALSAVSQTRPDAVVIGLGLDDMPGADLCVQVKRSPTTHTVPVLLYGTVAELEAVDIAENAHRADDFLQAPIKGTALVQRILALVGRGVSRIAAPPEPPVLEIQPLTGTDSGIDNRRAGDSRSTQDLAKIKRPGNDHDTLESAVDLSAVTPRPNLPTAPPPPPKPPPPEEWSARQSSTRKNLGSIPRTSESQQELESQAMREMANDGRGNSPLSPPASASPSPSGRISFTTLDGWRDASSARCAPSTRKTASWSIGSSASCTRRGFAAPRRTRCRDRPRSRARRPTGPFVSRRCWGFRCTWCTRRALMPWSPSRGRAWRGSGCLARCSRSTCSSTTRCTATKTGTPRPTT